MAKELVVLEREKIKQFESMLHVAKGKSTLNSFLHKCSVSFIYIQWAISGESFVVPHDSILRKISDASNGRVSFEDFKELFKGYKQPEIRKDQIWYVLNEETLKEKTYYVVDENVGGESSGYIKISPINNIKGNPKNIVKYIYKTLDGIVLKSTVNLDEYIIVESSCLLSCLGVIQNDNIKSTADKKSLGKYLKEIILFVKKCLSFK